MIFAQRCWIFFYLLKVVVSRDLSTIFHESNPPGPVNKGKNGFAYRFVFAEIFEF